jgi:hypothetical protein
MRPGKIRLALGIFTEPKALVEQADNVQLVIQVILLI